MLKADIPASRFVSHFKTTSVRNGREPDCPLLGQSSPYYHGSSWPSFPLHDYLYAYKGGSLYQPVYRGERTTIESDACTTSQLKYQPEGGGDDEDEA